MEKDNAMTQAASSIKLLRGLCRVCRMDMALHPGGYICMSTEQLRESMQEIAYDIVKLAKATTPVEDQAQQAA